MMGCTTSFISASLYRDIVLAIMLAFRMVRRRGEIEVLIDVLSAALDDVKVTHLMYRANLSYSTLRKYLSGALDKGLICKLHNGDGSSVYRITDEGKLLLEKLRDIKDHLHA
jgi:predicted transcriptional regulator